MTCCVDFIRYRFREVWERRKTCVGTSNVAILDQPDFRNELLRHLVAKITGGLKNPDGTLAAGFDQRYVDLILNTGTRWPEFVAATPCGGVRNARWQDFYVDDITDY